jgi:hypothetical protein
VNDWKAKSPFVEIIDKAEFINANIFAPGSVTESGEGWTKLIEEGNCSCIAIII